MTAAAWILMLAAWTVITGFMVYFLVRVLRTPVDKD